MPQIDEQKFLEIYDQNVGKIYRYIYFRLNSEELAQDLTSEVFLKSWQYLNQTDQLPSRGGLIRRQVKTNKNLDNPRAFIYKTARNLIVDFYRQKDKMPISLEEISVSGQIVDKTAGPEEIVFKDLQKESIKKALLALNSDYQEVIIWRYLDEMEIKEIAEILDKSERAVRALLSRALANLKRTLA